MRQISFLLISTCLLISGYVQADAQNFQGLRVGGNLNMIGASTKFAGSGGDLTFGGNNIGGGITVAVSQRISNKVIIGVGASFSNSKIKSASSVEGIIGKNLWTAFIEPGVVVGQNTLLYGKAGYAGMKTSIDGVSNGYSSSGYVYGLGIRTMVVDSLYVEVEALQYKFDSKEIEGVSIETKATSANVGVGYIFN